jgi:hypothetical protein
MQRCHGLARHDAAGNFVIAFERRDSGAASNPLGLTDVGKDTS